MATWRAIATFSMIAGLEGCVGPELTPVAPYIEFADYSSTRAPPSMPLSIWTTWSATCGTGAWDFIGHKAGDKPQPCKRRSYKAEVRCTQPCVIHLAGEHVLTATNRFEVDTSDVWPDSDDNDLRFHIEPRASEFDVVVTLHAGHDVERAIHHYPAASP